jgi:GTP-binding protein
LAALSAARPEIGAYPFTTLAPNLGVATVDDVPFVVVDIPGLIEGAHTGRGLGHRFLRHVERARMLVHVVDVATSDPVASYEQIRHELELYDPELLEKPEVVVANKMDLPEAQDQWHRVRKHFKGRPAEDLHAVSALTGAGVPQLLQTIRSRLEALRADQSRELAAVRIYRLPREEPHTIERTADGYRVRGRRVEVVLATADLDSDEGIADLQRQLGRIGVLRDLERTGVKPGDTVHIGDFELEWT